MNKAVKWLLFILIISICTFIIMQIFNYEENEVAIVIEKVSGISSLAFTIALTLTFNFNLKATFNKEIYELKVKVKNLTVINTNKIDIKYNEIDKEQPCLGLDVVGYRIEESLIATKKDSNDAIVFENPNDLNNSIKYFILLEPKGIILRNDEIEEIHEYRKTTFQQINTQSGIAIADKPYHLFVFHIRNVSKEFAVNVYPEVKSKRETDIKNNITHRRSLAPNEKILFMVLVNYASNTYDLNLTYSDKSNNRYTQSIRFESDGRKLEIYEDKFLPPSKIE